MTPEEKAKFDAIKSKYNYQPPKQSGTSDWFTATAPKPVAPPPQESSRIVPPTFPASEGTGLGAIVGNSIRPFGNLPSSALNLGAMAAKPALGIVQGIPGTIKDIAGAGFKEGSKALLGGFFDTYKKIGEAIYGGAEQAIQAYSADPQKFKEDAIEYIAKIGIEDPLLIPSLFVGGPKTFGSKADVISTVGRPGAEFLGTKAGQITDAVGAKVAGVKSGLQDKAVVGLQTDLEKYARATKSGGKKLNKNEARTEALNKAGTTGKTAPQVLAESHIIPRTEGTKFKTADQADEFLESLTPLNDALEMGLKEVAMSSPPKSLAELEQSALQRIASQAMPEGDRAALASDVMQEFALLRQKYGNTISVEDMQNAKSSYWAGTKFDSTKPFKSDAYYQVAKSFQQGIEDVASKAGFEDVAQLNREIGDRLEGAKFLKNLDGQTLKYGKLGKYVFMGIGASLGTGIVGKILGAAGGEILGQLLIDASVSSPVKRLLLRNLEIKSPEAYKATLEWAKQQGIDRELRLLLPEGTQGAGDINQGRAIPVMPSGSKAEYVGPEGTVGQSRPNALDTAATIRNASTDSNILETIPQELPKGQGAIPETIPNKEGGFIKNPFAETPADLEPLAAEARKYGSAEEFVKGKYNSRDLDYPKMDLALDRLRANPQVKVNYVEGFPGSSIQPFLVNVTDSSGKTRFVSSQKALTQLADEIGVTENTLYQLARGDAKAPFVGVKTYDLPKTDISALQNKGIDSLPDSIAGIRLGNKAGFQQALDDIKYGRLSKVPNEPIEIKDGELVQGYHRFVQKLETGGTIKANEFSDLTSLYNRVMGEAGESTQALDPELPKILRGTKGLTADDIMKTYPNIKLTKDVPATDIYGNKRIIPDGEKLTPYELKGNKILLQDGETYLVSKNQFENIKGQSVGGEPKPFAPELKGTEESIKLAEKTTGEGMGRVLRPKEFSGDINGDFGYELNGVKSTNGYADRASAQRAFDRAREKVWQNETKYSSYQLPGGKNYKEVLIKAPEVKQDLSNYSIRKTDIGDYQVLKDGKIIERFPTNDKATYWAEKDARISTGNRNFKSSHWDEPNVISHLRLNERTYKGKKVAFMEELQSDWAREGRSKGFTSDDFKAIEDPSGGYMVLDKEGKVIANGSTPEQATSNAKTRAIPNNPLLKNWQELSIKRALQDAVDSKADYFAWINGEQTSARYNLATHVEKVEWRKALDKDATHSVIEIQPKEGSKIKLNVERDGTILGGKSDWTGKKLDEVLGKGLADKIMEKETGTLSGEGLKFGGEWAHNLYDKQVKNIVEDLTGGKVEVIDMGLPIEGKQQFHIPSSNNRGFSSLTPEKLKVGLEVSGTGDSRYIITDILGDGKFKAVPKANITTQTIENLKRTGKLEGDGYTRGSEQSFDISQKTTTNQAIKLTPEIKAKIRGEALKIKTSGKMYE